ncbi:hypothetical protein ACJBYS_07145, partial [Streptococcus suis]
HNYLEIEDKVVAQKWISSLKRLFTGDKRREESFHAYDVTYITLLLQSALFWGTIEKQTSLS